MRAKYQGPKDQTNTRILQTTFRNPLVLGLSLARTTGLLPIVAQQVKYRSRTDSEALAGAGKALIQSLFRAIEEQ